MDLSPNLAIPYIMAAQAQKHVTHNEAVRALDCLLQLSVKDRDVTAPPAAPADGDRYIVGASPSGAWTGKSGQIAAWQETVWSFYVPREGWTTWVADEDKVYAYDGTVWMVAGGAGGGAVSVNPVPLVGVNATADTTNRLAVKSPAVLFDNDGAGHQIKINKAAASDTGSLVFQTAYSGRAEMGLTGDDNYHVKVSANGTTWTDAIVIDRTTGVVTLPQTPAAGQVSADWAATSGVARILNKPVLGTAAAKDTGTAAGNVVVLDAAAKLPAVDGSQLTNLPSSGGGGVNPNLVINGDFQINQRVFAGGALAAAAFGYDRWKADIASNMTRAGFVLTLASGRIAQVIDLAQWGLGSLAGQPVTVSVDAPSADLLVTIGAVTGTITAGAGRMSVTLTPAAGDTGNLALKIASAAGGTVSFSRVKAELGAAATNWQARPLSDERRLCQHYFYRRSGLNDVLAVFSALATTVAYGPILTFPVSMRIAPVVTLSSPAHLTAQAAGAAVVVSAASLSASVEGVRGSVTMATAVTLSAAVRLIINSASGYIDANAEL